MTRRERIKRGAGRYAAKYRNAPHLFARDYLHLDLKLFQKILLILMIWSNEFIFIGSRGIGKTFLSSIFCVIRCILWPETQIVVVSSTKSQAINVLQKIVLELVPNSPELNAEIKRVQMNSQDAIIEFWNGSYIKVVTAGESARGNRANLLLVDEYRLVSKDIIDTILKKFLTRRRMPRYSKLSKAEKKNEYAKEKNKIMYLSSAYFVDHWSYRKCEDTKEAMLHGKKQFVCGLPYELSIYEGLLDPDLVASEMAETDFSEAKFLMEYAAEWFGGNEDAFFQYESIAKNRSVRYPMLPDSVAIKLKNADKIAITKKIPGEIRIMSVDIALMSSKKNDNDASAIFIVQKIPVRNSPRYTNNEIYTDSCEGLRTDVQALYIRRLYEMYGCDYLVLDTMGAGLSTFDELSKDMYDPEYDTTYPALSCMNDDTMASRCTVPGADKVIWSMKASAAINSDCAYQLREAFRSGKLHLLVNEFDADEYLSKIKGYSSLSDSDKKRILAPYVNTTLLIDELTKLEYEESNGKVKIHERSGMRKDRYSSLSYNYYVGLQIENKLNKKRNIGTESQMFKIKAPSRNGGSSFVKRSKQSAWTGF